MSAFRRMTANTRGRDLAVGDIHGHFERLQECLEAVEFDPAVDRLFSVGDLVDRGPASPQALEWLAKPWFSRLAARVYPWLVRHRYRMPHTLVRGFFRLQQSTCPADGACRIR